MKVAMVPGCRAPRLGSIEGQVRDLARHLVGDDALRRSVRTHEGTIPPPHDWPDVDHTVDVDHRAGVPRP